MARATENLSPVTGAITPELREALEEYRWANRKTLSEVIRSAVEYWAEGEGIWSAEAVAAEDKDQGDSEDKDDSDADADKADADKGDADKADADKADADKTTPAKQTRSTRAGK